MQVEAQLTAAELRADTTHTRSQLGQACCFSITGSTDCTMLQVEAQLAAAESRADNTQRLADSLLAQHYNEWVPHWVADGYERVRV